MKRWIHRLYPPHDEIAVFLMSIAVITLAIVSPEVRAWVGDGMGQYAHSVRQFVNETPYTLANIGDAFGGLVLLPIVLLVSFVAALYLPFTTRELRHLSVIVTAMHAILMIVANGVAFEQNPHLVNVVFLVYAMSWIVVLRVRDPHELISDRQAHPLEGLYYAVACVSLLVVMLRWLDLHWAIAYSLSISMIGHMRGSVDRLVRVVASVRPSRSVR